MSDTEVINYNKLREDCTDTKIDEITSVDKHDLDEEWVQLPRTFSKYSKYLGAMIGEVSHIKDKMELKKGEIASPVRSNPNDYGLLKVTEGAIYEIVFVDEEYSVLNNKLREAEDYVNSLKAAIRGLELKKDSLIWLTRLHLSNYYADRMPDSVKDSIEEKNSRAELHEIYQRKVKLKREKKNGSLHNTESE